MFPRQLRLSFGLNRIRAGRKTKSKAVDEGLAVLNMLEESWRLFEHKVGDWAKWALGLRSDSVLVSIHGLHEVEKGAESCRGRSCSSS